MLTATPVGTPWTSPPLELSPSPREERGLGASLPRVTLAALATVSAVLLALPSQLGGLQSLALAQQTPSTSAGRYASPTRASIRTTIDINPGDSVHWTNAATQTQTVTSADGLLDSGALAPGSGFSVTLAPGNHAYTSSTSSGFTGLVRVGSGGLSGPLTDLANSHLPKLDFPRIDPADVGTHPRLGAVASRTHILLGFTSTATVGQANTVLRAGQRHHPRRHPEAQPAARRGDRPRPTSLVLTPRSRCWTPTRL